MKYIRAEEGVTSFSDTCRCCKMATDKNIGVVCKILGKDRYFVPNMNPHDVYDHNNDLIGKEVLE